jgi:CheY-like chemotaxis protein
VQAAAVEQAVSLAGARILVAEDDELNQEIVLGLLEAQAVQADLATDGWAAVELAGRKRYDLILMDLHMPVMDGFEASMRIREMPGYRTTPIIALTSDDFSTVCDECQQAGMNDHVSKPFDADQFCAVIGKWLRKSGTS